MPSATAAPTVAELEGRLRAGDESVTAADLMRAEAEERFARAQAAAAAQAAADRAEAERRDRVAALRAALPAHLDPAPIDKARAGMEAAIAAFLDTCCSHDDAMDEVTEELRSLGPLPVGLAVDSPRYGQITDGATTHRRSRPQATVAGVVTAALRARWPRQGIDLNRPTD